MELTLENPKKPNEFIFLTTERKGRELRFEANHVRWNQAEEENEPIKDQSLKPCVFSTWWSLKHRQGWRVAL